MKTRFNIILAFFLISVSQAFAAPKYVIFAEGGLMNGFGLTGGFGIHEISQRAPLGIDFFGGYVFQSDPGNAVDARKIFINDATAGNNNIVESGSAFYFGFDLLYPIVRSSPFTINIAAGPRYSSYAAFFDYIGGNEAFKVYSNAWGLGAGLKFAIELSDRFSIGLKTMAEYFFNTQLKGHGFFYNENRTDDHPRNNYNYGDADRAINQPLFYPKVQLFVSFRL